MQDLRIILIILGAVAIAALLIHGLWTSQKARQKPIREKPIGKVANGPATGDDFDRDGIGSVRVLGKRKAETVRRQHDDEKDWQTSPHFSALNDDDDDEPVIGLAPVTPSPARPVAAARPVVTETELQQRERQYRQGEIDPLFDEPEVPAPPTLEQQNEKAELNVAERKPDAEPEPVIEPVAAAPRREVPKTWQDVYVINLVARPNQQLAGGELARVLADAGFSFGDMDIFHRHHARSNKGEAQFSLINMVKPGTFNPNTMGQFSTPGVSIFMQLPAPGEAKNNFNLMVHTAEKMAEELDALLLDAQRSPLSPDYLAHCREQLRDYDSQAQ